MDGLRDPNGLGGAAGPVGRGGAGDDAVEIFGEALRLLETLLATGGASVPIGELGGRAVVGCDDGFRLESHFMFGAVCVVGELFRVVESEAAARSCVTGIGGTGGVAAG